MTPTDYTHAASPLGEQQGASILSRFLTQTHFESQDDFIRNLHFKIPEHFNFAYDVMDVWADEQPDKTALLWTNDEGACRRFSFAELKTLTDRTAAWFTQLGIGRGDKVMLILKRRYEFWLSMLALHKIGAIAIPATHMLTRHDIVYRNTRAGIKAIVCVGEEYAMKQVSDAMADSPTVEILVSVGPQQADGFHDWQREWPEAPAFARPANVNDNDDTMLMYFTSGTSGEPKMVAHDYLYALGHLTTGVFWHNLTPDSIHLTVADTGWGKAVWGKLYGQWFAGATVFVFDHEKFTADKLLRQIEKYRITSFCAPPTVYRFMIHEDFSRYDLSSLRYCTTAGEALNPAVYDKFRRLTGISLMEGFGQTEGPVLLATFPWVEPRPGSMGKPSPLLNVKLLDDEGREVEDGEEGAICVTGLKEAYPPGLFVGYYGNPEKTAEAVGGEYYNLHDMAWRDSDGYCFFVGRNDDVIKCSGYRIGPFEVESALVEHPAVVECAVTAAPDPIRGKVVKATVVLARGYEGTDALTRELQEHVKKTTAPYKYPRIIEYVDELPKTIGGKIKRKLIRTNDGIEE